MPNENVVKIGVFLPADTQLLDMACVDVYAMMGKDYLAPLTMLPKHISEAAPHVKLLYITSPGNDTMTVPTTAAVSLRATNVYTDAEVQPGELDILVVPGADPEAKWQQGALDFLYGHARCGKADILSVCTGIFLCGEAGLLDGRRASGPRGLVDRLKKQYPKTRFVGQEYRWVQDGNFWSSVEAWGRLVACFPIWRLSGGRNLGTVAPI
ncbi:hypothetical protein N3K66_000316 [Trichothecium roseum]|uniref:Uncharacterized protein n=1 Tax=Trichothecium roseum TaxID=47278 RepID=A0ACC0VD27_9HYPO|nr:hypothetical protein N3K66_000316 [Trichothecium roseum]